MTLAHTSFGNPDAAIVKFPLCRLSFVSPIFSRISRWTEWLLQIVPWIANVSVSTFGSVGEHLKRVKFKANG
jgi:hypothetical protein